MVDGPRLERGHDGLGEAGTPVAGDDVDPLDLAGALRVRSPRPSGRPETSRTVPQATVAPSRLTSTVATAVSAVTGSPTSLWPGSTP
ncbi:hypothetical protein GCM10025865_08800 [Paraoerskovia sediminicola]|uniref:Uncharacterized protein n=1 Tax=Paraoerskovia sediminicola TaxID=1138587 RepID=A0ABN6XDE0_9CELL|nr:hypothetical protein GCM10025865_08800 [Paraoerskovia sediminicola]